MGTTTLSVLEKKNNLSDYYFLIEFNCFVIYVLFLLLHILFSAKLIFQFDEKA